MMSLNQSVSTDVYSNNTLEYVSEIVAAYVSRNTIPPEDVPSFVNMVHLTLQNINRKKPFLLASLTEPAVSISESIQPDYLVCLEDGKKMKMLKRHLKTAYGMTPVDYRQRWNLPLDYPMVAPNYAKKRRSIAINVGLGTSKKVPKKKKAA